MGLRVAIYTLPHCKGAVGGEDQVGNYLVEALHGMGHEGHIFYPHEYQLLFTKRKDYDCLISNGVHSISPIQPSCYWHLNESLSFTEGLGLSRLGYTHFATASEVDTSCNATNGLVSFHLPMAACAKFCRLGSEPSRNDDRVSYVGNLNDYKRDAIEHWLNPIADAVGNRLKIYGGTAWRAHKRFEKYYQGVFPQSLWQTLPLCGSTWINFRSFPQRDMKMTNDRIFWLLAVGVHRLLSDTPIYEPFQDHVGWCDTPDDMVAAIEGPGTKPAIDLIMREHLYDHRVARILKEMGVSG